MLLVGLQEGTQTAKTRSNYTYNFSFGMPGSTQPAVNL